MFWLQIIKNFIKILRAGQTPAQIAGGFALGAMAGISPVFTLQSLILWLVILVLNVNLSAAILSFTLFTLIAYIFDPLLHTLGFYLLVDASSLHGLWTSLYNAPVAPLTRFNNTVVLGSFVAGFIMFIPLYIGMKRFVVAYRTHIGARIERWRVYQIISKSALVRWYGKIRRMGE
ncbi:MAG: TIGR03546 family protein [Ignavibacteria bacterium]|nr:TIGR03546 family protein [Ignavibacteria bacterium]